MILKGKIPFVRFLIPLICGILIGSTFPAKTALSWGPVLSALVLGLLGAFLALYKKKTLYRKKWAGGILAHFFLVLTGCLATVSNSEQFAEKHFSKFNSDGLIVEIKTEPKISNGVTRFQGRVVALLNHGRSISATGNLLIAYSTGSDKPLQLNYGDAIVVPANYSEVKAPYNPAEFDYKKYLADHKVFHQAFFSERQIVLLPGMESNVVMLFAVKLRQQLVVKLKKYLHNIQASSLAATLILGYRSELDKDIVNVYSKTGTMHVLSVSGMHVGIVFIVLTFIFKPLNKHKSLRYVSAAVIITLVWFYALITGFSPSVCRAAVMLSFFVLGKTINKNQNTYNLIAISAFFLLIYDPYYLFDLGFQLSYLAVIGLVFFQPKIYRLIFLKNWLADKIWSYCALSLAAQLATFPLSLYYFHQFPVYFLVSNLFIVIPVILIMYGGLLFLFIPWSIFLRPLGEMLNVIILKTNSALAYIERLPFSTVKGIWLNTFQFLLIYAIIFGITYFFLSKKPGTVFFTTVIIFIFCSDLRYTQMTNRNKHEIVFYSLRKRSAIAYISSGKALVLSDILPADKILSFSVDPFLIKHGIEHRAYVDISSEVANVSRKNFIKLGSYKILRWDKSFNKKVFSSAVTVDALLLTGNPDIALDKLSAFINFSVLLIDGTNSDFRINSWRHEARKLHFNFYVLKNNPAYIVKL